MAIIAGVLLALSGVPAQGEAGALQNAITAKESEIRWKREDLQRAGGAQGFSTLADWSGARSAFPSRGDIPSAGDARIVHTAVSDAIRGTVVVVHPEPVYTSPASASATVGEPFSTV